MKVVVNHILPNYPDKIHVQWTVAQPIVERLENVVFSVERSGSPGGPWSTRASDIEEVFYTDLFRDGEDDVTEENLLSLGKQVWYRVNAHLEDGEVLTSAPMDNFRTLPTLFKQVQGVGLVPGAETPSPDPQTLFSPNPGMQKRLKLIQRAVQRRAVVNLQYFSGVYIVILKRKSFGVRCTKCFDQASKSVLISNCADCYGTGWEGGYYSALLSTAKIEESPLQAQTEQSSKTEIVQAQFELLDFPRLKKDDVIVEVDSNRRWIVSTIGERSLRRRRLTQHVSCSELSRTAVQYRIPVNTEELLESIHDDPF